jgi:hypothetical protein
MKSFSFVEGSSSFGIVAAVVVVVVVMRGVGGEESPLARGHVVTTCVRPCHSDGLEASDIV